MDILRLTYEGINASLSIFSTDSGRKEIHGIFIPVGSEEGIAGQCEKIVSAIGKFFQTEEGMGVVPVMKRVFLSDVSTQGETVLSAFKDIGGAISLVGQSPLYPSVKVAALVFMVSGVEAKSQSENVTIVRRGKYKDLWFTGGTVHGNSYESTLNLFESLSENMARGEMRFDTDCLRTWLLVKDIDNRYSGVVDARNRFFEKHGLTSETHFIASTGIEGSNCDPHAVVTLDAFATSGLKKEQVRYLNVPLRMNRTSNYGVSFERATAVDYGDRTHVIVSGTASIDNEGNVVGVGSVGQQCVRMCGNVDALLLEGGATIADISHIIVYLRDMSDSLWVKEFIASRYPDVPFIVVLAPVCRPQWLVEMECMAIVKSENSGYAPY